MKRILVIDDEIQIQDMVQSMLENEGYAVSVAANGRQGIDAFHQHLTDIVITDIMMPGKDGIETIREIRKTSPEAKIIAMTGYRGPFNRLPAAEYVGAQITLLKPFTKKQLLQAVHDILQKEPSAP